MTGEIVLKNYGGTPATPSSDYVSLYSNADVLYAKTDTGAVTVLGGSGAVTDVRAYGVTMDGVTDDTAAWVTAVASLSNVGGVLEIPAGTTIANINLSHQGALKSITLQGQGMFSTTIKGTAGVIIDAMDTSRLTMRDLRITGAGSAQVGLFLARDTANSGAAGANGYFERVRFDGSFTVAQVFNICYEVTNFSECTFYPSGTFPAPCMIISAYNGYGTAATSFPAPHSGTVYTGTQANNAFDRCSFIKDNNSFSTITGPCVQIGAVSGLSFNDCYIHAPDASTGVEFVSQGRANTSYNVVFNNLHFESNYPGTAVTSGAKVIQAVQTGGTGSVAVNGLVINNALFYNKRGTNHVGPYYSIDFDGSTAFSNTLSNFYARNIVEAWGGGMRFYQLLDADIRWIPTVLTVSGAISAGATSFVYNTSSGNTCLRAGDNILVGHSQLTDADVTIGTTPEYHTIASMSGSTVNISGTFAYNHYTAERFYINPQIGGTTAYNSRVESVMLPSFTTTYGHQYQKGGGAFVDQRIYYGPAGAQTTSKIAPAPVFKPFVDAPNLEQGLMAVCRAGGDWGTLVPDVDNWSIKNYPTIQAGTTTQEGVYTMLLARQAAPLAWDPGAIVPGSSTGTAVPIANAVMGDVAVCSWNATLSGLTLSGAVTAAGTVTATLSNNTAGTVDLAAGTVYTLLLKR